MFYRNTITKLALPSCAAAALALAACAATPPPPELVDARQAYSRAQVGPAEAMVPAQVLAAQQALTRAEQSFATDPDSPKTRDLAYIAQRRAEIAEAQATLAIDRRDRAQAETELQQAQARRAAHTEVELDQTRAALASQSQVLAVQEQQLTAEQRARRAAERQARAAMESLQQVAAVKEEARGMVITLNGSVLFATGQSTLLPIAQERLSQVAKALADNPNGAITVEGHTDSTGSASANDELSRHRAEAVREFLISQGVDKDRIRAVGLGSSRPVADNKTPEGRADNRRVEIVIQHAQRQ
jgi:outer membrane protein OmpA-like peptidoglycan-associated protein